MIRRAFEGAESPISNIFSRLLDAEVDEIVDWDMNCVGACGRLGRDAGSPNTTMADFRFCLDSLGRSNGFCVDCQRPSLKKQLEIVTNDSS